MVHVNVIMIDLLSIELKQTKRTYWANLLFIPVECLEKVNSIIPILGMHATFIACGTKST